MRRIIIFAVAALLLSTAVSAFASKPTSASTPENCIDNPINHGAYVSCIARQHLGGAVTSQAAQSDIGKKDNDDADDTDDISPTVSPTITPTETITPTVTPSVTEAPTETPAVTPTEAITPTTTPTTAQTEVLAQEDESFQIELKKLFDQLIKFLTPLSLNKYL